MSFYKPKIFKHYHVSFLKLGCPNFLDTPSPLVLKRPKFMNPSPLQNSDIINGRPLGISCLLTNFNSLDEMKDPRIQV